MTKRITMVAILCAACGGGEEVPTCQQAVTHYYDAGCAFFDADGNQYSVTQAISDCKGALANAPDRCQDELEDLRVCLGNVTSPASSNSDCDCSAEQDALLTCE